MEPIFEADLEPNAYGYRPKRSAVDAVSNNCKLLKDGFINVVDADLSKYFETITIAVAIKEGCICSAFSNRD